MLDSFDKAKTLSASRAIKVDHGRVAEAEFRKWLRSFLPKRYGVTSGYIISQGFDEEEKTPHFDVIIYDQIESPILWSEDNPDNSEQGHSLAIPAEYVKGIIEVKSSYSPKPVKDTITHISKLEPLLSGYNPSASGYNLFLPNDFFWAAVFFEFKVKDKNRSESLNGFIEGQKYRGFLNGLILRYEGFSNEDSGHIVISQHKDNQPKKASGSFSSDSFLIGGQNCTFNLFFSTTSFSDFAFGIVRRLNPKIGYTRYAKGSPNSGWAK